MFAGVGCQSLTVSSEYQESVETCEDCQEGPKRWSQEWYAERVGAPEGARQRERFGKQWPPFPRPVGESQEFSHRFHSTHYWPHPYNCQDRSYLSAVSEMQTANGWTTETTLYDYHFENGKNELNHAGHLHLRWILETIPKSRRFVWVQMVVDQPTSQARLAQVKETAKNMVGESNVPPVMLRVCSPAGRPTREVDRIRTLETESIPTPRITYSTSGSGEGGGESGESATP
ncbi:MAG: hypothetical protein Tsb009_27390 [Planctomycetaceae bacterium]